MGRSDFRIEVRICISPSPFRDPSQKKEQTPRKMGEQKESRISTRILRGRSKRARTDLLVAENQSNHLILVGVQKETHSNEPNCSIPNSTCPSSCSRTELPRKHSPNRQVVKMSLQRQTDTGVHLISWTGFPLNTIWVFPGVSFFDDTPF